MKNISLRLRRYLGIVGTCCLMGLPTMGLPTMSYAADRMLPGQWEFTTTTDGDPHVFAHCMSAEDAGQINADSASGRAGAEKKAAGRCTVKSYTAGGNSVEYTLVCGSRTIDSATVFRGDTSDGTLTTTAEGKTVKSRVTARRLGACS